VVGSTQGTSSFSTRFPFLFGHSILLLTSLVLNLFAYPRAQYGTVDPYTLNQLLEYVHACFGDKPLSRGASSADSGGANATADKLGIV
jgi:hypothetical protein